MEFCTSLKDTDTESGWSQMEAVTQGFSGFPLASDTVTLSEVCVSSTGVINGHLWGMERVQGVKNESLWSTAGWKVWSIELAGSLEDNKSVGLAGWKIGVGQNSMHGSRCDLWCSSAAVTGETEVIEKYTQFSHVEDNGTSDEFRFPVCGHDTLMAQEKR